ncbi:NAD(P)/FAD-dependent oxidoreductase [Penaeicola halotolerans]|uniref:NAD(P)/FAD-dependent oxidoreductase n=1 Tax=Penaeicola halotolerans TaxID=2793196 RepID=UPI001CF8FE72|nr:NAD(P)/FAD-dependent oxidoreductase [Penaeicola halotolerans]
MKQPRIAIIGAGAAGFFAAIHAAETSPKASVTIFEKTSKVLAKVSISGGGRCNVTNHTLEISKLVKNYPRGEKFLKKVFQQFAVKDTIAWFEARGVKLKVEPDMRMFPVTDRSASIIQALTQAADRLGVRVQLQTPILQIDPLPSGQIRLASNKDLGNFDAVIVTTGGGSKLAHFDWLKSLGHEIASPVPSLFTFNYPKDPVTSLSGVAVPSAYVKIEGAKLEYEGPLLITHWGMSGPAVLKLSAWGARWLEEIDYRCRVLVRWQAAVKEDDARAALEKYKGENPKKLIVSHPQFELPSRLWVFLITRAEIPQDMRWVDCSKKLMNKLIELLCRADFEMSGKTTFKEEFVTAGGVALSDIDPHTMQSRKVPNLYFAGEVIDVDGITGGFNFQAAWSTGYVSGKSALGNLKGI